MNLQPSSVARRGFGGARWIIAAVVVVCALAAYTQIRGVLAHRRVQVTGDGVHVQSYGFDLSQLAVPRRLVVAGGMPKDELVPLRDPRLLTAAGVDSLNRAQRGKYLVGDDLVIGVVVGGAARAYPLRVMNWHEVADDTLGGLPVAVCWHPLSGVVVVLDRRLSGRTLDLGVSGLLYDSHHLLYDREPPSAQESLWAPLLARAVSGPATGDTLAVVPHALARWSTWRAAFPATTVPAPDPALRESYGSMPYGNYESSDVLRFPVGDLPAVPAGMTLKTMLAATRTSGGQWTTSPRFDVHGMQSWSSPGVAPGPVTFVGVHAYWFAWQALRTAS